MAEVTTSKTRNISEIIESNSVTTDEIKARFYDKFEKESSGCWMWQSTTTQAGYGILALGKAGSQERIFAHRLSVFIHDGAPSGYQVNHTCGNSLCVNPEHLYLGSAEDNTNDALHNDNLSGWIETKFTPESVREVRNRVKSGEVQRKLADEYNVSAQTISNIVRGVSWKQAGGPIKGDDY